MGIAFGSGFPPAAEVTNECIACQTRFTVRILPSVHSVELEVIGSFCERCAKPGGATLEPSPAPVDLTHRLGNAAPGPGVTLPRTDGMLLGVELLWTESTSTRYAHLTESYFEAAIPVVSGLASTDHAESSKSGKPGTPGRTSARPDRDTGRDDAAGPAATPVATVHDAGASDHRDLPNSRGHADDPTNSHSRAGDSETGHSRGSDSTGSSGESKEQEERYARVGESPERAVDLAEEGLKGDLAEKLANLLGERAFEIINDVWKPEYCMALAALADKLDELYSLIRAGIAGGVRIVLRWAGASDFTAALIGELVASSISAHFLYPLKGFAQLLRVTGTACCAACGCAGSCACARSLTKDLFIKYLNWLFDVQLDRVPLSDSIDKIVAPGMYLTYEYMRNTRPDDDTGARRRREADEWEFWAGWQPKSERWFHDFTHTTESPAAEASDVPGANEPPWATPSATDDRQYPQRDKKAEDPETPPGGNLSIIIERTEGEPYLPSQAAIFGI